MVLSATVQFDPATVINHTITHKIDDNLLRNKGSVPGFEFQAYGFLSVLPDNTKSETRNSQLHLTEQRIGLVLAYKDGRDWARTMGIMRTRRRFGDSNQRTVKRRAFQP